MNQIRAFFAERGVMEVQTPVLGHSAGTDPAIETFQTWYRGAGEGQSTPLYLQTSPEFYMKRLLAQGSGPIYQVAQVFRNGEVGARHQPEFSLLEWYRPDFDEHRLMAEVSELLQVLLQCELAVEKIPYCSLFEQHFGWNPLAASTTQMANTARQHGIDIDADLNRDQWLDLLISSIIEPELGREGLTFVYDYPASQASLARLHADDERLARRFELYLEGVELANGFFELTDAKTQRARFEADNQTRCTNGQQPQPIDELLLQALHQGLPDCAGVALGLDRLLMLKAGATSLDAVLPFSFPQL